MKKYIYIIVCIAVTFFTSCSLQEEFTFNSDKSIHYNLSFDFTEMANILPKKELPTLFLGKDSIVSVSQVISEKVEKLEYPLSDEQKTDLLNVEPLFIKLHSDSVTKKIVISMVGDFKNIDALNKALISVYKLKDINKNNEMDMATNNLMFGICNFSYAWNGKVFERKSIREVNLDEEEESIQEQKDILKYMLGTNLKIKYNFSKEIKDSDNEESLYSRDKKSIIIEYPMSSLIQEPEKLNIKIVTK